MRVAITVWNGHVAPVFDAAGRLLVLRVEQGRTADSHTVVLAGRTARQRALCLARLQVDTLVCGAISMSAERMVSAAGIRVVPFVTGGVDEIVRVLADGAPVPDALRMPGYEPAFPR